MIHWILTLLIISLAMTAMAVGLILQRKSLEKKCHTNPEEECSCKQEPQKCRISF